MKKIFALACAAVLMCVALVGCGGSNGAVENKTGLEPGTYTVTFKTDSTMFAVNEAYDNKGTMTVTKDSATVHVVLKAKGICNLYLGSAADAKTHEDRALQATEEKVTYSDGLSKKCYAFDIPVSELNKEFDCAIKGTDSGKWWDHKVTVSDPQPVTK